MCLIDAVELAQELVLLSVAQVAREENAGGQPNLVRRQQGCPRSGTRPTFVRGFTSGLQRPPSSRARIGWMVPDGRPASPPISTLYICRVGSDSNACSMSCVGIVMRGTWVMTYAVARGLLTRQRRAGPRRADRRSTGTFLRGGETARSHYQGNQGISGIHGRRVFMRGSGARCASWSRSRNGTDHWSPRPIGTHVPRPGRSLAGRHIASTVAGPRRWETSRATPASCADVGRCASRARGGPGGTRAMDDFPWAVVMLLVIGAVIVLVYAWAVQQPIP
jgi:hypothetical protein